MAIEEGVIFQYVSDLDARGFPPNLGGVEDMANLIFASSGKGCVDNLQAHRFVKRRPELKIRSSRAYDFQRALCEDSDAIGVWYRLVDNMRAKYDIKDCDFDDFDETGFMMGAICPGMVVMRADRQGWSGSIQPRNREWATAIHRVNSEEYN